MSHESAIEFSPEHFIDYAVTRGFGDVHFKVDAKTGLYAIIAIHSTKLGPALGGCRCLPYPTFVDGWYDALRLARGMSFKAALVGLKHGGGKSVLIKPKQIRDQAAYFRSFAEFVNDMNGRYITAVDSGTTTEDMDIIGEKTKYVASLTQHGEPSPSTALGVLYGIEAAVKFKLGKDSLKNIHVAIQGLGKVGYSLAKRLHELGAKLSVADVNSAVVHHCVAEFGAQMVSTDKIHTIACDVLAPCALGATLNAQTIPEIQAPIVAGAANNQLAHAAQGQLLHERTILYAPDYVINAGGLIFAAARYDHIGEEAIPDKIRKIGSTLEEIFQRSSKEKKPTSVIADEMAKEKLS